MDNNTPAPCPLSAFVIAAAVYREAVATASRPGSGHLVFGDQHGEGWLGVMDASRRLGEWIEERACGMIDFDNADFMWTYFWDETPEVARLFAAIDCKWPPASPAWVELLDAAIARRFPLLDT